MLGRLSFFVRNRSPVLLLCLLFSNNIGSTNAGFLCRQTSSHELASSSKQCLWVLHCQSNKKPSEQEQGQRDRRVSLSTRKKKMTVPSCTSPPGAEQKRRRKLLILISGLYVAPLSFTSIADASEEIPNECRNGNLVMENAVPGAYQQVCMTLSERQIPLKATQDILSILQGDAVGAGRTGVAVWNSGLLLTRLLDALTISNSKWLQGKTVIELGAGTGLASIAVGKFGAKRVIATDGNPDVVDLAQQNINRNFKFDEESSEDRRIMATPLSWGFLDASDYMDTADVIIGSDLTYNSGTWKILSETFSTVLKPGGIVLYLSLGHAGFNVNGELNGFLSVVTSEGQLEVLPDYYNSNNGSMNDDPNWPLPVSSVSKTLSQCISKEEQTVLNGTGGAKVVVLRKKMGRKIK